MYILISLLFDFIVLISLSIVIISFTNKTKLLYKLAFINSILIVLSLFYIIFLESSFEHIRQIKWGYYAFIITNLLLFYYSNPIKSRHNFVLPTSNLVLKMSCCHIYFD
jgi:hypothetical protein